MKNLERPAFLNIILNGTASLAARFAQLEHMDIRQEMKKPKKKICWLRKKVVGQLDFYKVFTRSKKQKKAVA